KKITELKGLIYFTDGCGNYPKTKPDYEAAFVFVSDNYEDTGVPPWAIEIILDKEEIYSLGGI
ncbi:MAG: metallopeptidase, partial [Anaerotignaceae bacterium]